MFSYTRVLFSKAHKLNNFSTPDSLQLDNDACANLDSMIVPCCGELRELNSGHHHKIVEITENAGKCLQEEYLVRICTMLSYHMSAAESSRN